VLADRFAARTRIDALELLRDAGVPVAPVQSRRTWAESDTVRDNALFAEIRDPTFGAIQMPPIAADLSATPGSIRGLAREIGVGEVDWEPRSAPHPGDAPRLNTDPPTMPLAGISVLDLGAFVASPFAGSVMCDLGADVVKVEPPNGDDYRVYGASFVAVHQGKRGVSIDLKTEAGRRSIAKLIGGADVIIHNYRVDARRRLGLDARQLLNTYERLVVCELSAWGEHGGLRDDPAFDPLLQARAGLMDAQGDGESPRQVRMPVHDTGAACMLALGGLAALTARGRIGIGQRVSTSMVAASLVLQPDAFTIVPGRTLDDLGRPFVRSTTLRRYYRCSDGWVALPDLSARERSAVCGVLGVAMGSTADRATTSTDLRSRLESTQVAEAVRELRAVGVAAAPVLTAHQEYRDEFLTSNEFMHTVDDPTFGPCTVMRHYVWCPDVDNARGASPGLGEHNEFLLGSSVD
jgi:crotonobetainyl-CoA:carnitine CoA-transferase CaiB-like acyl-CoA transferase